MNSTAFYILSVYLCSETALCTATICHHLPNKAPKWIILVSSMLALISMGIIVGCTIAQSQTTP